MKESKLSRVKSKGNEMDPGKEIALLKNKLKDCRKKYNSERKRTDKISNDNYVLLKEISALKKANNAGLARCNFWMDLYRQILETVKISSRNYCNSVIENNAIFPDKITEIEFHKAELEKIINKLSSLIRETDLLGDHGISEFLSNKN